MSRRERNRMSDRRVTAWTYLYALVLSAAEDSLEMRRVDDTEEVSNFKMGMNGVKTLKGRRRPDLRNDSEGGNY